jgi:ABC-type multidrug transport system ATPase subunit
MIRVEDLVKAYGRHPVLSGVSLQVAPGEVLALVGPNGAGKSTTLRILAGIIRPDSGVATVGGRAAMDPRARRALGYLPQKPGVPGATSLLSLANLVAAVRDLPQGTGKTLLAATGFAQREAATLAELSGGQRQRLMLALATLGPVSSLLLDEPGISLDADGADDVHERIREARERGTAVLFTSHHLSDVSLLADRVAVMVQGAVIAQGTLAELAKRAGVASSPGGPPSLEMIYRKLVARSRASIREVA